MSLLWGLLQIATAPLRGVVRVVRDVQWKNWEEDQMLTIATLWLSSVLKWTVQGIEEWIDSLDD